MRKLSYVLSIMIVIIVNIIKALQLNYVHRFMRDATLALKLVSNPALKSLDNTAQHTYHRLHAFSYQISLLIVGFA